MYLREGEKRWCISGRGRKGGVSQGGGEKVVYLRGGTEREKVVYLREVGRKGGVSQGGGEKVVYLREGEKRWCISGRGRKGSVSQGGLREKR